MTPNDATTSKGTGEADAPPSPICFKEYDKPCGCEKCEAWIEYLMENKQENDNG